MILINLFQILAPRDLNNSTSIITDIPVDFDEFACLTLQVLHVVNYDLLPTHGYTKLYCHLAGTDQFRKL